MAYDEELAQRVRVLLAGEERIAERAMFGGLAFLAGGHMAVAVSGRGGLMIRTDPDDTAALLDEPGAGPMEMRGRLMDGWLRVDAGALADPGALERWVAIGLARARALPPKPA